MVNTDHCSVKFLPDQRLATIPQHQWVSKLMGFDFSVEYKSGASNTVANALSRRKEGEAGELAHCRCQISRCFMNCMPSQKRGLSSAR
jgi:hypothetical protein